MVGTVVRALRHPHALGYWAFAVAIAYLPGLPSNAVAGRWWLVGLGAAAFLLARAPTLSPGPGHAMGAALLIWMALGFAWSISRWDTAGELAQWVVFAAVFAVAGEEEDLRPFWVGLALGASISAGVSLAQVFGFDLVWSMPQTSPGLFLSKNMAADVYVVAIIGALAVRMLWPVPPLVLGLFFTGSRAAVLSFALAGAFCALAVWGPKFWALPGRDRAFLASVVSIPAMGVVALLVALGVRGDLGQFWDRAQIWALVIPHIGWIGDGLGSFAVAAPNLEYVHNEVLHYAFELGIGSAFLWGIAAYALGCRQDLGARAVLAAVLGQCLVWFPLHAPVSGMVAAVVAGHLCGLRDRARWAGWARRAARTDSVFDGLAPGGAEMLDAGYRRLLENGRGGSDLYAVDGGCEHFPAGPPDQVVAGAVSRQVRTRREKA